MKRYGYHRTSTREKFNLRSLTEKVEQVISMVGPRYSKELNVKTGTYNNLSFMLKKDGIAERLQDISSQIKDCTKKLLKFDSYNQDEGELVLAESRKGITDIVEQLQTDSIVLDSDSYDESELTQVLKNIKECEQNLIKIFEVEKKRFEKKMEPEHIIIKVGGDLWLLICVHFRRNI